MTVDEALALNGLYCRLQVGWPDDDDGEPYVVSGRVLGVVVPCPGSPVACQLLLHSGGKVSACGGGLELFLDNVQRVLHTSETPYPVEPPRLSLLSNGGNLPAF